MYQASQMEHNDDQEDLFRVGEIYTDFIRPDANIYRNWLRDYSQAMDTGALKKAPPETIRILVWLLSFLGFGYATAEFEVTSERLGVYRPEEHIEYVEWPVEYVAD